MVDLAIAGEELFVSSDVDVQREGPTFTFDTLTQLRAEYGVDDELFFLLGADALAVPFVHDGEIGFLCPHCRETG